MQFNVPAEFKNASGVYIIRNSVNSKVYVGSAKNFRIRAGIHRRSLLAGKHHSVLLQRFASKHGVDNLIFSLLELVEIDKRLMLAAEQKWLDYYKSYEPHAGFNICAVAYSCLGIKRSEEYRQKMSEALKGKTPNISPEGRAAIIAGARAQCVSPEKVAALVQRNKERIWSDEQRARSSEISRNRSSETRHKLANAAKKRIDEGLSDNFIHVAKHKSPEHLKKISEGQRGKILSPEHKAKFKEGAIKANSRRVHSEETRAKIAAKATGRKASEAAREAMRRGQASRPAASEETRIKLSKANKGRPLSAEHRAKLAESAKLRYAKDPSRLLRAREAKRHDVSKQITLF